MLITGQFRNIKDELYTVYFLSDGDDSTTKTIGENGLFFGAEPVVIETNVDSTFEHVIRKSATINLVTDNYVGGYFFANNARNIIVNIYKGNECVFAGYVEPNTFNQPFTLPLDEFTVNCVDALSVVEYSKYDGVTLSNYTDKRNTCDVVTFKQLLTGGLGDIMTEIDIQGNGNVSILYDCSKGIDSQSCRTIFSDLTFNSFYFFGDEYDDVWDCGKVIEEMLKYLNLHIIQEGFTFYIYDWNTPKNSRNTWFDVINNQVVAIAAPTTVPLTGSMHAANDTDITVDEVYNQVSLTCNLESEEMVVESPLDKNDITSLYNGKNLYMREYISEGNGNMAFTQWKHMVWPNLFPNVGEYEEAKYVDWYMQPITNNKWKMRLPNDSDITSVYEQESGEYINSYKVAKYVKNNALTPAMFRLGKVERNAKVVDNSPTGKLSTTNYIVISINGNQQDNPNTVSPNAAALQQHAPIIEYLGARGGTFSPADSATTNYLVFSGKIMLQPIQYETDDWQSLHDNISSAQDPDRYYHQTVPSKNNEYGRYYTRKFFKPKYVNDPVNESVFLQHETSLQPYTSEGETLYGYKYSDHQSWTSQDLFSKLQLLECELIIGNKRLIETDIDEYGNSTFQWVTLGQEPTFVYEDDGQTYTQTTFSLGINPKFNDYILGNEYDIQNTITIEMNLDTEGTAIPITKDDNLSGAVQFRILGPIHETWNNITRRHPTWFRHTQWTDSNVLLLAHTENLWIKDLQCKLYSDSAGLSASEDGNDLIYMSDETNAYINKKDDIDFEFITQPTAAEAVSKGLKQGNNINAVTLSSGGYLSTIYNATTAETAKPEEHYVDAYYTEYCTPKLKMTMTVHNASNINFRNKFASTILNKNLFVESINFDTKNDNKTLTLKEI